MHTSLSKKLLAGLLSLVMVLSLVAPSMGTQAASKYSLTDKKSVKSDVTYKYQLKGVSKNQYVKVTRNVSGETVKYNKKAVSKTTKIKGTGKTLNLYVTYGEKAENYTGKFTVKVYSKKTNKVAKTLVEKVTVKVSEKEAVTSVAINNTTPKVGDTITATVEPSNATNVSFAWYVLNSATEEVAADATPVSTTASYTTVAADAGKYVKVNVQGDNGSSASAVTDAVKADEGEKIAIASAKQTGAAKIEVSFNKAIATTDYDITLAKGTAKQEITVTLGEDNMSATLTAGVGLSSGDYTVTITKKADAKENASSTVTCEKGELKKIAFLGKELILTTSAMNSASVVIKGYNQFEEELSLSGSLKPYTSKGTATYDQKTSKIRIAAGASTLFNVGEQITVTAVYTSGSTVLQVAEPLTVSNVATLTKFELGDLATTKKELKDKKVTLDNFKTNTYYLPVKVAEDQYGNKLTAKDLDDMMIKPNEPAATAGNIYITPNSDTGSYAYVTGFEKLDDGTTAMKLALGSIAKPGKAIFSVTGVSGYSGTHEIEIEDNSYIAKLSVSAPNLYSTVASTLDVSAVDQYGNTLNLYDYVTAAMVTASPYTSTTGPKTFNFNDKNNLTGGNSSIQIPKNASLTVSRDTSKKTVTFKYTPATRTAASEDIITLQSATPAVENLTWNVDVKPSPAAIKALGGTVKTTLAQGTTTTFSDTTVRILDNNNALIDYANPTSIARVNFTTDATPGAIGDGEYYAVVSTGSTLVELADKGTDPESVTLTAKTTAGSAKVKFELVFNGAAGATQRTSLDEKEYTFNVSTGAFTSYKAKIAAGDSLLYVNKDSADTTGFSVVGVDANGAELATTNYTVTVDSDLKINGKKVSGAVAGIGSKGTAVATIWAPVYDAASGTTSTQAVATVDVPYDVAAPAAQSVSTWNDTKQAASTETNFTVTSFDVNADGSVTLVADNTNTYILSIDDQYGLPMANTKWAIDGTDVPTVVTDWTNAVLTATSAKVAGSWTISGNGVTPTVAATKAAITVSAPGSSTSANFVVSVSAPYAGNLAILDTDGFVEWNADKTQDVTSVTPANVVATDTVTAGKHVVTIDVAATKATADTAYYVVYQSDDTLSNAIVKTKTVAASPAKFTTTLTGENAITSGEQSSEGLTCKDQFGNAYTFAAQTATAMKAGVGSAATATIAYTADGKITISATLKGTTNIAVDDTFTFELPSGETLTATCTTASDEGVAGLSTAAKFKLSIA